MENLENEVRRSTENTEVVIDDESNLELHLDENDESSNKGVESVTDFDVSWRLMSGKIASPETRLLLSEAVALFHLECFEFLEGEWQNSL
ncbi:hypothetical protein LguiA_016923 [Lonicera macranthoides]